MVPVGNQIVDRFVGFVDQLTQTRREVHVVVDVEELHASGPRDCVVFDVAVDRGVCADGNLDAVVGALEQVLVHVTRAVCFALGLVEFIR